MRFVLLGSDNLAGPLRELGHEALFCAPGQEADLPLAGQDPAWPELAQRLKTLGFRPDAVLVCDNVGYRTLPGRIYESDALTVFYGIDSPLNRFWQQPYARLFDLAFMDQPLEAEVLARRHGQAHWLPVGIDPARYQVQASGTLQPGAAFVGVVDEKVRPKRSALLNLLGQLAPVKIAGGRGAGWFPTEKAAELYRSHRFVLNENLFPGLTTRPLEVMASGGALLSEAAPGAMDVFFRDQEHLLYFSPQDLRAKIELMLNDDALCRRLAQTGQEAVLSGHTLTHRAAQLVEKVKLALESGQAGRARALGREALYLEGRALFMAGLRWPAKGGARRVLAGAGRLLAAAGDQDRPLPVAKWAGLAALVLGEGELCLKHLHESSRAGGTREALALALAARQLGRVGAESEAWRKLSPNLGGVSPLDHPAWFHVQAARLLAGLGLGLIPGFDARKLPPALWSGLEHMIQACRLRPEDGAIWEELGDLLLAHRAPNEAHHFYGLAGERSGSAELAQKIRRAGEEGYLQWAAP